MTRIDKIKEALESKDEWKNIEMISRNLEAEQLVNINSIATQLALETLELLDLSLSEIDDDVDLENSSLLNSQEE
jgi:hypothetical protein